MFNYIFVPSTFLFDEFGLSILLLVNLSYNFLNLTILDATIFRCTIRPQKNQGLCSLPFFQNPRFLGAKNANNNP